MTNDIRDRLAEWIETHRSYDPESFGIIVESLAALVGEMLLSERAAALGAAVSKILAAQTAKRSAGVSNASVLPVSFLVDRISALSPEGWVGVRAEDLAVVKETAQSVLALSEAFATDGDDSEISTLRAALARLP